MCLTYFFGHAIHECLFVFLDMPSMSVCTTRHWQTSGRLVQELNVCTLLRVVHTQRSTSTNSHFEHAHALTQVFVLSYFTVDF